MMLAFLLAVSPACALVVIAFIGIKS
jgi:hypothetical protein